MGVVYRATQLDLERLVALKLIASQLAEDPEFRDRFVRESRAAASIDHPNVIPIFYTGESDGALYIAMRYVEGDDLRTLARREGRLTPGRAANIVAQVGSALDAAHARGIVHRDVKPANVLLGPGDHAYLTDFGLTKRLQSHTGTSRTGTGGWVGTLGYVAPEQIRGGRVDARTDVYALGCVLFHALTGTTPYQRDSDEATLWAHLNDDPPAVTEAVPGVPAEFEQVIRRALAKDPDERFQSAGDLGRAALAAAGAPDVREPERLVATGAAAPADSETVVSPGEAVAPADPTVRLPPGHGGASDTPVTRGGRRGWPVAVAAGILLLAAAGAAIALSGGGGGGGNDAKTTSSARTATTAPSPSAKRTFRVGRRPNDVTIASGKVWVTSFSEGRVSIIDVRTGRTGELPLARQRGTASIAAGYGSLWIANQETQQITRIRLPGRESSPPIQLPPGRVVSVAVGQHGVWVGSRGPRFNNVVRIDPSTNTIVKTLSLQRGVQDLSVGEGSLWVIDRSRRSMTRIRVRDGRTSKLDVRDDAYAVEVGQGYVWVTSESGDSVTRINPRTQDQLETPVGTRPQGIASGGGATWVANRLDNTLTRLDPKTGQVAGEPVRVGVNPFAVAARGKTVFVTNLGDNTVTRVTAP
jgi:DNA-binding beta-propeller fold protein YncE